MFDQKLYQETFDQVTASEETLSEVLNMTKKQNHHYGRRFTRMLVIAAVISVMLATTAFAYVGFTQYENPMEMLKTFFGAEKYTLEEGRTFTYQDAYGNEVEADLPDVEKVPLDEKVAEEDVAPYVSAVGQSLTFEDYTLTVEAHLYDSATDCGIVYYALENPNGVSGYEVFDDGVVWWPNGEMVQFLGASGENYVIEDETTDTKLSVAVYYCGAKADSITLGFYGNKTNRLSLSLDDGGGMDAIALADGDILVSPIGMKIDAGSMEFLRKVDTDGTLLAPMVDNIKTLIIRYKDGTEYVIHANTEDQLTENYKYCIQTDEVYMRTYSFNRLIDIDQVKSVIINDVEFSGVRAMDPAQRDTVPETAPQTPAATEPANP